MEQEEEERTMGCLTIKLRCMNALPSLLHWETMLYHFTVKSQFKQQDYLSFFFLVFVLITLVTDTWWKLHMENFSVGIISVLIQGT